jgi:trans-AT polyketide synthase, acyltransferase and oxidoreductase domains
MSAIVFPGQGSQRPGMGEVLFDQFPEITERADQILGYSIKSLCLGSDKQRLNQTDNTQPALFVVNALSYLKHLTDTGRRPDHVAGHSVGEYAALLAAHVFDFATGLRLVQKRGELMHRVTGGGMAAVIGMDADKVQAVLSEHGASDIDVANFNSPLQIVISGPRDEIVRVQPFFEAAGVHHFMLLNVSGAFHSRHMESIRREFAEFLHEFEFSEPRIPVISNVDARPYTKATVKELLSRQITHAVNWTGVIQFLLEQGSDEIIEVGPGGVLTKLVDQIKASRRN